MPYRKILVPTDLSQYSLGALRYAEVLADAADAELIVAHFRPNNSGFRHASQQLRDVLATRQGSLKTEAVVVVGDPLAQILDLADDRAVDLIVMGTQGRSGLRRAIMGSVAEAVVRHASCSVMTLRYPEPGEPYVDPVRGPRPPLRRVLVPLDFSALSLAALPVASTLARAHEGAVQLLHVLDGATHRKPRVPLQPSDLALHENEATRKSLEEIGARELQGVSCELLVARGQAAPTILEQAAACHSDIIVMTTHGRAGLARLIMGSTAESVVRKAHCPVLTVRGGSGVPAGAVAALRAAEPAPSA